MRCLDENQHTGSNEWKRDLPSLKVSRVMGHQPAKAIQHCSAAADQVEIIIITNTVKPFDGHPLGLGRKSLKPTT